MSEELHVSGPMFGIIDNDYRKGMIEILDSEDIGKTLEIWKNAYETTLSKEGRARYWGMKQMVSLLYPEVSGK